MNDVYQILGEVAHRWLRKLIDGPNINNCRLLCFEGYFKYQQEKKYEVVGGRYDLPKKTFALRVDQCTRKVL